MLIVVIHRCLHPSLGNIIRRSAWISAEKFLTMRNQRSKNNRLASERYNVKGVYILHNRSKHKYYVGQAHKLLSRVNGHLTGKGNGNVYADFAYGDRFYVRFVRLKGASFKNLNDMERYFINKYHAQEDGYNKTIGNR
jgi:hypothetical protein